MKNFKNTILILVLICTLSNLISSRSILTISGGSDSSSSGEKSECEKSGVFGVKGMCIGEAEIRGFVKDILKPKRSKQEDAGIFEDVILPTLIGLPKFLLPQVCFGDFDFSYLSKSGAAAQTKCSAFPLSNDAKVSAVGFSVPNVPCGDPTEIDACAIFSKCGTFGLAINGGILTCFTYATGVLAWLAELGGLVDHLAFGYSPNRKFNHDLEILDPYDKFKIKKINTKGHFFVGAQLAPPELGIAIGENDLSEYVALNIKGTALIDFGKINDWTPTNIKKMINDKSRTPIQKLAQMLTSVREISFKARGNLQLLLANLTRNVIPDITVVDNVDMNVLINFGKGLDGDKGDSGMPSGIYTFIRPPPMNLFGLFVEAIMGTMIKVLKIGFIPVPKFPRLDGIEFGVALSRNIGFRLKILGFEISCLVRTSPEFAISCDLDWSGILTFFSNAGKWIAKQGKIFFDNAKKAIMEFGQTLGDFAKDIAAGAKVAAKAIVEAGKKVFETAKKALNAAKAAVVKAVNAVANVVKNLAKKFMDGLKKAAKVLKNALKSIANTIGNAIKNIANAIANIIKDIFNSIFNRKKHLRQRREREEKKKRLEAQRKIEEAAERKKYDEEKARCNKEVEKIKNGVDKKKLKAVEDSQLEENEKEKEFEVKKMDYEDKERMMIELDEI